SILLRRSPSSRLPSVGSEEDLLRRAGAGAALGLHLLDDGKALELRMAEIERLVSACAFMRLAEGVGACPCGEILLRSPKRMRGLEHMIIALRAFQQVEDNKTGHGFKMRLAREPYLLEVVLRPFPHFETIHGDKHASTPRCSLIHTGFTRSRSKPDDTSVQAYFPQFHIS